MKIYFKIYELMKNIGNIQEADDVYLLVKVGHAHVFDKRMASGRVFFPEKR